MSGKKTVLVAGATGNQGGAAANALLQRGHNVVALTRNPKSDNAQALAARGASLAVGDFSDRDSLIRAAAGVDSAYAMTTPFETGIDAEIKQGNMLIEAMDAANVGHLVLGSVADANNNTGIPHFDSKFEVEKRLAASGLAYTIVAPVYFMDNALAIWGLPALKEGKLAMALPEDKALQQVSVKNIGEFAAAMIERREAVFGRRFDIAGDELTGSRAAAVIAKAAGREIRYEGFPPDFLRAQSEDLALMFEWFERTGYSADIEALRHDFPEVAWQSLQNWADEQDWSVIG